jgi:hypothetical protein
MLRQNLTLVIPERFHQTYTREQRAMMLRISDFIEYVRRKQT